MSAIGLLPLAVEGELGGKVQVVAVVVTAVMLFVVLELVRRRRLAERYALLWMSVAVVLLVLAIWNDLLGWAANLVGIDLASNALFLAAFGAWIGDDDLLWRDKLLLEHTMHHRAAHIAAADKGDFYVGKHAGILSVVDVSG